METATKTRKPKRQEEHTNSVSWRFVLLYGCIFLALTSLLGCVARLQIISPDVLVKGGDMRSLRAQQVSTSRSMTTDRSGYPLAMNVSVKAIWADPKEIHNAGGTSVDDRWKTLANALNIPLDQLSARINANPKGHFIYLARQVNPDMAEYIKKLKLPEIYLCEEFRRYYPSGEMTAHLIGFTDVGSQGIEGVERSFDKWLTRQLGERIIRKDRHGRVAGDISLIDSQATHNLTPSIDERLQALVYHELDNVVAFNRAESGSTVLMGVSTGKMLMMINGLLYDPNSLSGMPREAICNRTITDVFEPGSMVKLMVVMTVSQRGVVWESSVFNTASYRTNGHEIKDVARCNELTLTGVLQRSNSVSVLKLTLAMSSSALADTYLRLGLEKATNLGLVGEHSGLYPQKQRWSDIERATFFLGYRLMVTPLQLARVYVTVDSYGIYRPLSITKVDPPVPGERIFPEPIVRTVAYMMESVALPGGGGTRTMIKGCHAVTKTSTAKKVGPDGRYIGKYIVYTAGVAPVSQPYFALVVAISDPQAGKYYGSVVSAPVFDTIMGGILRTMSIEPDALTTGDKNEFVINQGEGTGGRL